MKHWNRRLPAKIICFILCIVSLAITGASATGAVLLGENGFYNHSKESMYKEISYDIFGSQANDIMHEAMDFTNGDFSVNPLEYNTDFSPKFTNLRFQVFDPEGAVIFQNTEDTLDEKSDLWQYFYSFKVTIDSEDGYSLDIENWGRLPVTDEENIYIVQAYLQPDLTVDDNYSLCKKALDFAYTMRYAVYPIGIGAFILAIFCFVMLMCASARRPKAEEIHPGPLNRVPLDVMLMLACLLFVLCADLTLDQFYYWDDSAYIVALIASILIVANVCLGLCMSIAARIKQGTLFANTLVWKCCKLIWNAVKWIGRKFRKFSGFLMEIFLNIPLIWRTIVIVCGVSILELIVIFCAWWEMDVLLVFWVIEKVILVPVIIYEALIMRKLQKGGIALANGDLSYQTDTKTMFWDFKRHGENLNSIAAGMATAVEERLQSEHMKTELITNVSHDIKTPLTSIINYAGLIEEEPCNSEKHKEYSAVLIRKSAHLKHLLDDLVEVSKATTGNLEVDLIPCEAGVLLTQAAGEFEQRCEAANLILITKQPEENIRIMADSRRIWRVFENLMSNACKYSLPGSRVYLSLERIDNEAVFTFRNTSSTALDITPEELMERFVRGDSSRTTEGNGLGLSIARSLTELQNGKMDITIDGDLFKVVLRFPVVE